MTIRPRTIAMFSAAVMSLAILLPAVHSPASASIASETSAFYEDALIRFDKNDYAGSIIQLRNVLQKDPTNLPARILLGRAQMRIGNAAAAEKELEIARKAGADEELIIEELAKSYLLQRKFSELLEKIKAGNRPPSVEALVLTARASANFEQHRFKVAMAEYDQAIKLAPERSAPLLGQARILIRQGNFAKAQSKVDIAQRLNPGYHDLWYVKGELHRVKNELEAAVLAYGKTISAIPGHLPARLKRAVVLIELGRPDGRSNT